jgi:hypothetical protein
MDIDLVRCPLGHGLFLGAVQDQENRCPACGAPLLAVEDDVIQPLPSIWSLPIDRTTELPIARSAKAGQARIALIA